MRGEDGEMAAVIEYKCWIAYPYELGCFTELYTEIKMISKSHRLKGKVDGALLRSIKYSANVFGKVWKPSVASQKKS